VCAFRGHGPAHIAGKRVVIFSFRSIGILSRDTILTVMRFVPLCSDYELVQMRLLYLSEREANLAVCKPGVEVADCPEQATCALGKLLHCAMPFERHADGTACVLNAEAEEEVNAVVEALG